MGIRLGRLLMNPTAKRPAVILRRKLLPGIIISVTDPWPELSIVTDPVQKFLLPGRQVVAVDFTHGPKNVRLTPGDFVTLVETMRLCEKATST